MEGFDKKKIGVGLSFLHCTQREREKARERRWGGGSNRLLESNYVSKFPHMLRIKDVRERESQLNVVS